MPCRAADRRRRRVESICNVWWMASANTQSGKPILGLGKQEIIRALGGWPADADRRSVPGLLNRVYTSSQRPRNYGRETAGTANTLRTTLRFAGVFYCHCVTIQVTFCHFSAIVRCDRSLRHATSCPHQVSPFLPNCNNSRKTKMPLISQQRY